MSDIIDWAWENVQLTSGETVAERYGERIELPQWESFTDFERKSHFLEQAGVNLDYLYKIQTGLFPAPSYAGELASSFDIQTAAIFCLKVICCLVASI